MPADQKDIAVIIAVLLDKDPLMAARVKEHLSEARLIELLGLQFSQQDTPGQTFIQDPSPLGELGAGK